MYQHSTGTEWIHIIQTDAEHTTAASLSSLNSCNMYPSDELSSPARVHMSTEQIPVDQRMNSSCTGNGFGGSARWLCRSFDRIQVRTLEPGYTSSRFISVSASNCALFTKSPWYIDAIFIRWRLVASKSSPVRHTTVYERRSNA